jgi:hypothetical protein
VLGYAGCETEADATVPARNQGGFSGQVEQIAMHGQDLVGRTRPMS